ncbi:MAG: response regulator [Proteobacteria bacterium]|nr:response regulator [Pseudomonadota bacterium]
MAQILIVEDEALIAQLLAMYVEDLGHEVIGPAATVDEALAMLNARRPAFAIIDCTLGHEECTPIADALSKANLPFAFATGHGIDALPVTYKSLPVISKPFIFEDVERVLSSLAR